MEKTIIKPQPGFQIDFLASQADIVIGGGAAGVGKTFVELLEPLYHIDNSKFNAMFFRRTSVQIRNPGGLWDKSRELYYTFGGAPREHLLDWSFPSGATIKFSHLEHENDILSHQGAEYCLIVFDELTHFTRKQFFYMLSRNRSMCGVKPYVRATCNPDPDSFVAELVDWWIGEDGYAIPERCGQLRYFITHEDNIVWGNSKQEVIDLVPFLNINENFVKSITFIPGELDQNKKLLEVDPTYKANLMALPEAEKLRLLKGNWKRSPDSNIIYDYEAFKGMFENMFDVNMEGRYITADIALKGSNLFVVGYWEGFCLCDVETMAVSNGKEVINLIASMAKRYKVENRNIVFDADGVGGYIDGFIVGAQPFNGGVAPLEVKDQISSRTIKENYKNLKAQCYFRSAARVNNGGYKIIANIAKEMLAERKAIKRDKPDSDGKLTLISKDEMKTILKGKSPDYMDMFMMREFFELKIVKEWTLN